MKMTKIAAGRYQMANGTVEIAKRRTGWAVRFESWDPKDAPLARGGSADYKTLAEARIWAADVAETMENALDAAHAQALNEALMRALARADEIGAPADMFSHFPALIDNTDFPVRRIIALVQAWIETVEAAGLA